MMNLEKLYTLSDRYTVYKRDTKQHANNNDIFAELLPLFSAARNLHALSSYSSRKVRVRKEAWSKNGRKTELTEFFCGRHRRLPRFLKAAPTEIFVIKISAQIKVFNFAEHGTMDEVGSFKSRTRQKMC
ncbi:hypothetical protein Y032_0162g3428 [Ancylostoma ceylanicum]|nr:hypothetical protein Y032_0162g3428 [Ancylostoma ceylanicum]